MIALSLALILQGDADRGVVYSKVAGVELMMDIHYPQATAETSPLGEKRGAKRMAVVMIHGGAWISGKRQDMSPLADIFAKNGFLVANVSYRLGPKHKWPAMLDDVQTAMRFLRENASKYNIDPDKIGATGASAGGHLAMFLGCRDSRVSDEYGKQSSRAQAVFNFFGPCDMTQGFPKSMDIVYPMLLGKKREDATAEIKDASPYFFMDKKSAPMFIYQGLSDPLVKPDQSRLAEAKYKELGIAVEARYLEGIGHEIKPGDASVQKAVADGMAFLKKHLR